MPRKADERQGFHVFSLNDDVTAQPPRQSEPTIATFIDYETDYRIFNAAQHQLTLDIETLINSSQTSRRAARLRREGRQEAPRPQNAWILYRKDTNARFRLTGEHEGKRSSEISKIISEMWKNEREEVKKKFFVLAKWAGQVHETANIDYRYSPRRLRERSPRSESYDSVDPADPFPSNLSNLSSPSLPFCDYSHIDFQNTIDYVPDISQTVTFSDPEITYVPCELDYFYIEDYDIYVPVIYYF
jgi:hypothetical protein